MKKQIRFIAVHMYNDFSGSPRVLADFCSISLIQSQSLTVVTNLTPGFLDTRLGSVKYIWYPKSKSVALKFLLFTLAQIQIFFMVITIALRGRIAGEQVVVINNTIFALTSLLASRLVGALTISYVHESISGHKWVHMIIKNYIRFMAHEVILVSKFLFHHYGFDLDRARLLPNGLRLDFVGDHEIDYEEKFERGKVLFVGSLRPYKGIFELIKIARETPCMEFSAVFNCTENELEAFLREKPVPRNLRAVARDSNLMDRYKTAFVVMNLSLKPDCLEGFALTVLEGMSFGCPCIVPPEGGHMDYFRDTAGFASDARNVGAIAAFITKLKSDRQLWEAHSRESLDISGNYSTELFFRRANALMLDIISQQWQIEN